MKARSLEVGAHRGESLARSRRQPELAFLEQPVNVVRAEPDALHVERRDGTRERLTFLDESVARRPCGLLAGKGEQLLNLRFRCVAGLCRGHC